MTDKRQPERDQRALDALFVSQLRRHEPCDQVDVDHLPKLTKEEKDALEGLGPDFIGRLLAGNLPRISEPHEAPNEELLCEGGMSFGLNRAEKIDDETIEELNRKRQEILERNRQKKEGQDE